MAEELMTTFVVLTEVTGGTDIVQDVRTELIYSRVAQIPAKGIFYGDEEVSRKLSRILRYGDTSFYGTWSSSSASYKVIFRGRKIHFSMFEGRSETDKLCEFYCDELEVETDYDSIRITN